MRRMATVLAMSGLVVLLAALAARADDDKEGKVALDKVPKAVLDAVKTKFKGAELVGASTEKEDGKLIYEINLKHQGHVIDASLTADGKFVSIEKTIDFKDLPKAVADAVRGKYRGATIKKTEEVTENDKTTFEVLLVTADKKTVEVVLDPDGKIVKEEKKEKEEKEEKDK